MGAPFIGLSLLLLAVEQANMQALLIENQTTERRYARTL